MILDLFLVILYIVMFLVIQAHFFKKNDILGFLWFLFAFVYSIFTIIAYLFFPFIPANLDISGSGQTGTLFTGFVLTSYALMFLVYRWLTRVRAEFFYVVLPSKSRTGATTRFEWINATLLIGLGSYFLLNPDLFSWGMGSESQGGVLYTFIFKYFIVICLIQFIVVAEDIGTKYLSKILLLMDVSLILIISTKSGSRSDILYLIISIGAFLLFDLKRLRKRHLAIIGTVAVFSFSMLQVLSMIRGLPFEQIDIAIILEKAFLTYSSYSNEENMLITALILNDYFAPAATLAMSIDSNIIIPIDGFLSNITNSVYLIRYPLLSDFVAREYGLFFLRSAGFAYFIFCEGFNFMGIYGVLYNGIIFGFILYFLRILTLQGDKFYQRAATSIVCLFLLSSIRGQSGVILKFVLFHITPAIITFYYALGLRMRKKMDLA